MVNERRRLVLAAAIFASTGLVGTGSACADAGQGDALNWIRARPRLRPKLLPTYFADAFPGLIHYPFSRKLVVGFSIDRGHEDEYVREAMSSPWKMPVETLLSQALANLGRISSDLPTPASRHGTALVIAQNDGYDAPRLLLPDLRTRMLTALGPEIEAAVPARDLLMAWSPRDPEAGGKRAQVVKEWRARPHALSDEIFTVTKEGIAADGKLIRLP